MDRHIRVLLSVVAALAAALPAAPRAQVRDELTWYAVEVIVFERISEIGRNAEFWPVEPGLPDITGAVELSADGVSPDAPASQSSASATASQTAKPRAFQLVPPSEHRLTDVWKRLRKSSAYRPLLHIAWIQPGYSSENARPVHLRNNNAALGTATATAGVGAGTLPALNELGNAPTLSSAIRVARDRSKAAIDGTLRVHRARYLHVQADFLYYRPLEADANAPIAANDNAAPLADSPDTALIEQLLAEADTTPRLFRLSESRRMRSRELHYLDHPLFGALVEIWPLELPEPAVAPAQAPPPAGGDANTDESGLPGQPAPVLPAPAQGVSGG